MLYLATLSQRKEAKGLSVALTRKRIDGMSNIPDLCPSRKLISRYRSGSISWQEFREEYLEELRAEYKRAGSRLRGLAEYARDKDVTLFVPDDDFHVGYISVLGEAVNGIWFKSGNRMRVETLFPEREILEPPVPQERKPSSKDQTGELLLLPVGEVAEEIPKPYSEIPSLQSEASNCEFFQAKGNAARTRNCYFCIHFDRRIIACMKKNMLLIEYEWGEPEIEGV